MIPFGDLRRTRVRLASEIDAALAAVLDSGWFVLGKEVEAFEREFAAAVGARFAIGVGNGTDAIALALRAAGVGPGDEVVTTPFSAAFTALAVSQIGATPVFADIDPRRYTLDPAAIERAVTGRTRAILPVHLYGQPADMSPIAEVAKRHGIPIVEDCAQSHGARYRGAGGGALGAAAAWSFYPSKNLGAFGDGGAVTTDDAELAERVRSLRNGGQLLRYQHDTMGVNSRLDELQAAILRVRLRHLAGDNARRAAIAARYGAALREAPGIVPPWIAPDVETSWHLYVVRTPRRDRLAVWLAEQGVASMLHYPVPIHCQPAYAGFTPRGALPNAEAAADAVLSIPIYPELTDEEVSVVCSALSSFKAIE